MELLAHISSKCSRERDARHRRQAKSYGEFEAWKTSSQSHAINLGIAVERPAPPSPLVAPPVYSSAVRDASVFIGDTQLAVAALESQIITSSLNALLESSPGYDFDIASPFGGTQPELAPIKSPQLAAAIVIEHSASHEQQHVTPSPSSVRQASTWSGTPQRIELPSTYEVSDEASGSMLPHQLPSSLPVNSTFLVTSTAIEPAVLPETGVESQSSNQHPHLDPPRRDRSVRPREEDTTPGRASKCRKQLESQHVPAQRPSELQPTSRDENHAFSSPLPTSNEAQEEEEDDIPLVMKAPVPATTILAPPPTFVTGTLAKLKLELVNCYTSRATKARTIRRDERGYWSFRPYPNFDARQWTRAIAQDMWRSLRNYIESGKLGWGVWCARVPEAQASSPGNAVSEEVRVFCWGEIVEHIFLLLYTVSCNRVKLFSPVWRDADGMAVVTIGQKRQS